MRRGFLCLVFFLCAPGVSRAQFPSVFSSAARGTTSAGFLKLAPGARAEAMGEAYSAIVDDAGAMYWNVAALTRNDGHSLTFTDANTLLGSQYLYAAYARPLGEDGGLGLSLQQVSYKGFDITDDFGNQIGDLHAKPKNLAISAGYAYRVKGFSYGAGLKYVESSIARYASTFALDFGVLSPLYLDDRLRLAFTATNLGAGLKFDTETSPLPMALRLGSYYRVSRSLRATADLAFPVDNLPTLMVGSEYLYPIGSNYNLALRAGLNTRAMPDLGGLAGFSYGLGLTSTRLMFDYSVSAFGPLGDVHRVSLTLRWGIAKPQSSCVPCCGMPAVATPKEEPEAAIERAKDLMQDRKWAEAEAALTDALAGLPEKDARRVYVQERLGETALRQNDFKKSMDRYQDAVASSKRLHVEGKSAIDAYLGLAYCREAEGLVEEAIGDYQQAMKLTQDDELRNRLAKRVEALRQGATPQAPSQESQKYLWILKPDAHYEAPAGARPADTPAVLFAERPSKDKAVAQRTAAAQRAAADMAGASRSAEAEKALADRAAALAEKGLELKAAAAAGAAAARDEASAKAAAAEKTAADKAAAVQELGPEKAKGGKAAADQAAAQAAQAFETAAAAKTAADGALAAASARAAKEKKAAASGDEDALDAADVAAEAAAAAHAAAARAAKALEAATAAKSEADSRAAAAADRLATALSGTEKSAAEKAAADAADAAAAAKAAVAEKAAAADKAAAEKTAAEAALAEARKTAAGKAEAAQRASAAAQAAAGSLTDVKTGAEAAHAAYERDLAAAVQSVAEIGGAPLPQGVQLLLPRLPEVEASWAVPPRSRSEGLGPRFEVNDQGAPVAAPDRPILDFVLMDNGQMAACTGQALGRLDRDRFSPLMDLPLEGCRLEPGPAGGLFLLLRNPKADRDELYRVDAPRLQKDALEVRPLLHVPGRITAAAGSASHAYVAVGREIWLVEGDKAVTVFAHPSEEIRDLAFVPSQGVFYATDSAVGSVGGAQPFEFLAARHAQLRGRGGNLYIYLPSSKAVLKVSGAASFVRFRLPQGF